MTEQPPPGTPLGSEKVAALLASAMRARRSGNIVAARALLRVLAADQPKLIQVWLALATVAETRAEQRHALEQVAALDPTNPLARRGLAHIQAATLAAVAPPAERSPGTVSPAASAPITSSAPPAGDLTAMPALPAAPPPAELGVGAAPALTPTLSDDEAAARAIRWPLYLVIGISILAVLAAALLIRDANDSGSAAAPTPTLPGAATSIVSGAATQQAGPTAPAGELPATAPVGAIATPAVEAATSTPNPSPTSIPATAGPTVTPRPTLAIGEVVKQGVWHAVLLRPEDAVPLDGSIGTFQPNGRFVLALVALGNDGTVAAPVPSDLFALVDQTGARYAPLPAVSTAYLNTYGRGQRGDLSMEDPIPADGSNKSVPLIFDVPETARGLYLMVKDTAAGWPVRQQ